MNFFRPLLAALLITNAHPAVFDFAILGDRTGNAVPGVYEQVIREIAAAHPDLVINVGDTIEGLDDATAEAQWEAMRAIWKAFGNIPFYLVPGNHDIWSPASERIWQAVTHHPPQYGFDFRGAHFTVLDNSRGDALAPGQLTFLQADLEKHADRQPKFIFLHRPSWLLPVKFQNGNFPLHQMAKKYHAGFVISGHVHEFDRSEYDGIQYLIVGSSGGSLTHGKRPAGSTPQLEGLYFGYAWAHVDGDTAQVEFRRMEHQMGVGTGK